MGNATTLLVTESRLQLLSLSCHPSPEFKAHLTLRSLPSFTTKEKTYELTIPGLRTNAQLSWDAAQFDRVLDACVPIEIAHYQDSDLPYDLSNYKVWPDSLLSSTLFLTFFQRLCRKFCHSMSILRCLDNCTVQPVHIGQATAVLTVIGFLCGLSFFANSLWHQIFDELRACCSARRQRSQTRALMFVITDHLGEMYKEVSSLDAELQQGKHSVSTPPLLKRLY